MTDARLRIVLPGGAATGADWVRARLPEADVVALGDAGRVELANELASADAVVAASSRQICSALLTAA